MFSISSAAAVAATITALLPSAFAVNGPVIPCARGQGNANGCGYCRNSSQIATGSWNDAKKVPRFTLPGAEAKNGGGYDVYWNVPHVDKGCKVILTQPFLQQEHEPDLSGNVILSTSHPGCFYAWVGSGGFAAGYCCGDGDCTKAGAGGVGDISKRSTVYPRSQTYERRAAYERRRRFAASREPMKHVKRQPGCWGGKCDDEPEAPPAEPLWTCSKAEPTGEPYTKAGTQQIDGETLSCNGGESCGLMPAISVTVADSVTNEHSVTLTQTDGVSLSATAGFMLVGPTATVTAGVSQDFSNAVGDSTSTTTDTSVSKTLTMNVMIKPGSKFNLWFTPTLNCQKMKMTCNDVEMLVEKCSPATDSDGNPDGEHGVMTVG